MITECNVKTVTEVENTKITITSSFSEKGNDKPTIFRADLMNRVASINKVQGQEGELLLTHIDTSDGAPGEINEDGELIIHAEDADNYYVNALGNLMYKKDE